MPHLLSNAGSITPDDHWATLKETKETLKYNAKQSCFYVDRANADRLAPKWCIMEWSTNINKTSCRDHLFGRDPSNHSKRLWASILHHFHRPSTFSPFELCFMQPWPSADATDTARQAQFLESKHQLRHSRNVIPHCTICTHFVTESEMSPIWLWVTTPCASFIMIWNMW